ncbi:hypothetical protein K443DRAFT_353932 [Laccaria amethystina LaAM-08-1]|uniref:Uncharacterized protein n=1 Tax=Laccaria amethystina LaAM-08-1 TaxID=1095629 RepID=A0A0C9XV24_9AGAR|nr:hypothetical protein K443DRAFT_353932 [Laccaria amethystina LaAM-08-1]
MGTFNSGKHQEDVNSLKTQQLLRDHCEDGLVGMNYQYPPSSGAAPLYFQSSYRARHQSDADVSMTQIVHHSFQHNSNSPSSSQSHRGGPPSHISSGFDQQWSQARIPSACDANSRSMSLADGRILENIDQTHVAVNERNAAAMQQPDQANIQPLPQHRSGYQQQENPSAVSGPMLNVTHSLSYQGKVSSEPTHRSFPPSRRNSSETQAGFRGYAIAQSSQATRSGDEVQRAPLRQQSAPSVSGGAPRLTPATITQQQFQNPPHPPPSLQYPQYPSSSSSQYPPATPSQPLSGGSTAVPKHSLYVVPQQQSHHIPRQSSPPSYAQHPPQSSSSQHPPPHPPQQNTPLVSGGVPCSTYAASPPNQSLHAAVPSQQSSRHIVPTQHPPRSEQHAPSSAQRLPQSSSSSQYPPAPYPQRNPQQTTHHRSSSSQDVPITSTSGSTRSEQPARSTASYPPAVPLLVQHSPVQHLSLSDPHRPASSPLKRQQLTAWSSKLSSMHYLPSAQPTKTPGRCSPKTSSTALRRCIMTLLEQ